MLNNFNDDLAKGKIAEHIVTVLAETANYPVIDVSDIKEYRHKGDLIITLPSGEQKYLEIKNDSVISSTGNILCEEEVYYYESGYTQVGNMHNESDYYIVVSQPDCKIYVLDFKKLQQCYKKGYFRIIPHSQQESSCYLLELNRAKQYGALIGIYNYNINTELINN